VIQQLPPRSAHDLREADPSIVHLDVRTPAEFAQGHPTGAWNVPIALESGPNPEFLAVAAKVAADKGARVVVSCAAGGRSQRACDALERAGWKNLVNVQGGFGGARDHQGRLATPGWADAGLPVSTDAERDWTRARA
jgi:rhodanese-related sulfurtransferase